MSHRSLLLVTCCRAPLERSVLFKRLSRVPACAALRLGTAAVVMNISRSGLRSCEPPGFRGNGRVCQFHATNYDMNTRVVRPRGFGGAEGFCVFQLWIQEGTAASALATSHTDSAAESSPNVGNVIVRSQDTSRASVQVVKPLVGDLSVAQVLNPGDLLSRTLGEERVLQAPETGPISES